MRRGDPKLDRIAAMGRPARFAAAWINGLDGYECEERLAGLPVELKAAGRWTVVRDGAVILDGGTHVDLLDLAREMGWTQQHTPRPSLHLRGVGR